MSMLNRKPSSIEALIGLALIAYGSIHAVIDLDQSDVAVVVAGIGLVTAGAARYWLPDMALVQVLGTAVTLVGFLLIFV